MGGCIFKGVDIAQLEVFLGRIVHVLDGLIVWRLRLLGEALLVQGDRL